MRRRRAILVSTGTALPEGRLPAEDYADIVCELLARVPREEALIRGIVRQSGVANRCSVLADNQNEKARVPFFQDRPDGAPPSPTTSERMKEYERHAPPLAEKAARAAMVNSGFEARQITHVVTVSCTGFFSPGIDYHLIQKLSLRNNVQRTNIGFMGCHAAMNALQTAANIARAEPNAIILCVCVELCSLHFQFHLNRHSLIPNALFADGAGSMIVAGEAHDSGQADIINSRSAILPETREMMSWRIGNQGFTMSLDAAVPGAIQSQIRSEIRSLFEEEKVEFDKLQYVIHPGGPRILDQIGLALELDEATHLAPSRSVLSECGNMSSPTVIHILERLERKTGEVLMMAFGPGLVSEMVRLRY